MKLFSSALLASALVAASLGVGCTESNRQHVSLMPSIQLSPPLAIGAGTSTRIAASTSNITEPLRWACSPNEGKLVVENATNGQTALFTANAPGTYRITATARGADGNVVESSTSVRVEPLPVTNERVVEPAPRR